MCTLLSIISITILCNTIYIYSGARGGVVVKALRYKPTGREFDFRQSCSPPVLVSFSLNLAFHDLKTPYHKATCLTLVFFAACNDAPIV